MLYVVRIPTLPVTVKALEHISVTVLSHIPIVFALTLMSIYTCQNKIIHGRLQHAYLLITQMWLDAFRFQLLVVTLGNHWGWGAGRGIALSLHNSPWLGYPFFCISVQIVLTTSKVKRDSFPTRTQLTTTHLKLSVYILFLIWGTSVHVLWWLCIT
jgi:hypothetical protein